MYNRLRKAKANNNGERDPLNRTGHVIAGSPGTHFTLHTFKLGWELPKQEQSVTLFKCVHSCLRCHTSKYGNFNIVSPGRTKRAYYYTISENFDFDHVEFTRLGWLKPFQTGFCESYYFQLASKFFWSKYLI